MSSNTNTKRRTSSTPERYASGSLYGLKFTNETQDIYDFDRKLNCTPDVVLLESNTKILLDYSNCNKTNEKTYLNEILNGISLGSGFTLENAYYFDPVNGEEFNLTGYFTCSATYDTALVGNVETIKEAAPHDKRYFSEGFTDELHIKYDVTIPNLTENNIVKNVFGNNIVPSFTSLGVKSNDFIRFDNGSNSGKLFEIQNFYLDENNNEVLTFGSTADFVDENRFNLKTDFSLYRTDANEEQITRTQYDFYGNAIPSTNNLNIAGLIVRLPVIVSSNKFSFFSKLAPDLILYANSSYIFDTTAFYDKEHEFRISSVQDGSWNGGTEHPELEVYDNFVLFNPKSSGTFYYYCTKHPNMGGLIKVNNQSTGTALQQTPSYIDESNLRVNLTDLLTGAIYL